MKLKSEREGSVLMVSLLTITILTMICATSLHITSQNANATTQTASWQQSLAGAESAVDQAMSELNTRMRSGGAWASGWYTAQMPLPTTKPTDTSVPATDFPPAGSYNYYTPPTLAVSPNSGLQDESGQTVATWVTVDTGGLPPRPKGSETYQAYRIRATGVVRAPGPARVSNRKLDNELRKISLKFDRFSGTAVTTPQAARRIEVIATPVINSRFQRAITLQNWLVMNGTSSIVDSFDSSNPFKSTNGQYPATELSTKRQSNGDVGLVSSAKNNNVSNLKDNAVYGSLQYSGPAVKKPGGVKGSVSTPFNTTIPVASDPSGTFTVYGSNYENATVVASGTASSPTRLKIPQNFSLQHNFTITGPTLAPGETAQDTYLEIWVPGNYSTSGNALVTQSSKVHVTWYVDGDISSAGNAYLNQSGLAANVSFIAVGPGSITLSGNADFIGTFYGPLRDVQFTGNGSLIGAVVGNNLTITSNAGVHYDEALGTNGPTTFANYAYASWFEDNSAPARNITY